MVAGGGARTAIERLDPHPLHQRLHVTPADLAGVCIENSIRVDLVTESPNVSDDGRDIIFLIGAVRLDFQVEEPT
jgi:hypothetical protein